MHICFVSLCFITRSVELTNKQSKTSQMISTHPHHTRSLHNRDVWWCVHTKFCTSLKNRSVSVLTSLRTYTIHQSQEPSFHPSFHLSSTREQSNSGFPSRRLTPLWRWQNHWDRAWRLLVSGWLVFNLWRGNENCLMLSNGNLKGREVIVEG